MKKLIRNNYKKILTIIVLGISVIVLIQLRSQLASVKLVNVVDLLPVIILTVFFLVVNGLITKRILSSFNVELPIIDSVALSVISTLGNLITPFRGGMVSNAIYLKNKYRFNFSNYVAMLSATYVVVFWVSSFIGLVACLYIKFTSDIFNWPVFMVFLIVTLVLGFVLLFSPKVEVSKTPILSSITYVLNMWNLISKNVNLVRTIIFYNLINIVLVVFISFFEFQIIGLNIPIGKLVILSLFSIFSLFLSVTPANIGIKEAFAVYSGMTIGIPAAQVIVVSLIDRMLNVLVVLLLCLPASYVLFKKTKTKIS